MKVNVVSLVLVIEKRPLNSDSFAPAMVTSAPVIKPWAAPVVTVAVPLLNAIPLTDTNGPKATSSLTAYAEVESHCSIISSKPVSSLVITSGAKSSPRNIISLLNA